MFITKINYRKWGAWGLVYLMKILMKFESMDQIFNTDETGLNYKMLSSKTLAAKADQEAPAAR